jgi:hypothetical protein
MACAGEHPGTIIDDIDPALLICHHLGKADATANAFTVVAAGVPAGRWRSDGTVNVDDINKNGDAP